MTARTKDRQKRSLFYRLVYLAALGFIIAVVVTVYLHFAYGWFAKNDSVSANGASVTADGDARYELAARDLGTVDGVDRDQRTPYDAGSRIALYLAREENGGYEKLAPDYMTDNEHTAILCHLINENPHEENSEDLAPGAFGVISFDIVLKDGYYSDFDIDFSFFPLGETAIEENGETVREPRPIVDPGASAQEQAEQQALLDELKEYLSGHVLFYKTRSAKQNGGYYYSDRLTDDSFTFELPASPDYVDGATGYRYYTVEIYWIWPSTFGQLALPDGDARIHVHPVYNDETSRGEILGYIEDHPGKFFRELAGNGNFTGANGESWESYNFVALSEGYNRADQLIGDHTQYLIVCIDVEPAGSAS